MKWEVDRGTEFHRMPSRGCGLRLLTCRPSPGPVVGRAAAFHSSIRGEVVQAGGMKMGGRGEGGGEGPSAVSCCVVEWNVSSVGLPAEAMEYGVCKRVRLRFRLQ
jgi:hypothetical protein